MLRVGDKAPNFSLPDQNGQSVTLADFLGKSAVVLFFYPKDHTSGCTAESCEFRDRHSDFSQHNAQVFGISQDGATSHQSFIAKHHLPYPLLTDKDGSVSKFFGLKKTLGLFPARATFVIDKSGIIRHAFSSQIAVKKHSEGALEVVRVLSKES